MSDGEYVSLPEKMRDEMLRRTAKEFGGKHTDIKEYVAPKQSDLDEIKTALKYILEKLTSLDRYVRQTRFKPGQYEKPQTEYCGEASKPFKEIE